MNKKPSTLDLAVCALLQRLRGARAEDLVKYPQFKGQSVGAMRKRLERLRDQGYLAASALPRGPQIFRLSHKGVALTGAPSAYATSPSAGIAAEMLAVSSLAWKTDEFLFPTRMELDELLAALAQGSEAPKPTGRFVLRAAKTNGTPVELRLHAFVAELRPADDLARRANVVIENLQRFPVFRELMQVNLLGLMLAVPSQGVKTSLEGKSFTVETSIVVVEALQDLIAS